MRVHNIYLLRTTINIVPLVMLLPNEMMQVTKIFWCFQCDNFFYVQMTVSVTHSLVLISSECGCDGQNKVCDAVSGQCVCPPNTIGRTCNQCNHTFWSWNETAGCQVMILTSFYNVCIENHEQDGKIPPFLWAG